MFKNNQVIFGLSVGFMVMVLGQFLLFISPSGWSLLAVGLGLMTATIVLNLPEKTHWTAMQPLLVDNTQKQSINPPGQSL